MTTNEADAERIFLNAIDDYAPEDWDSFLHQVCSGDPRLLRRVKSLLDAHVLANPLLEALPMVATFDLSGPEEKLGTHIGAYKLLEKIGEGGMGVVYMAEQREPMRRTVALKFIKPGMDTRQVVARFEAERQALALMNHPNIAKVLDAGATELGRPYFVMELVKGVPVTEFCDQQEFGNRQRLELFINICGAVQYAHQKGLIHRDIKPSNLLVEMHDVTPVLKVIDFGVARAIGQQLTINTLHTGFNELIGTPLYMSPEQAGLSSTDIDTRSDVYSLGVLLYEILTGHTPFESDTLRKASYDEMRRIIREVDPPTPSVRVSTLKANDQSTVSERRGVDIRRVSKSLRGELDWIVMKALEKDRNRRYDSPAAFAADIQRYLNDEPVLASPPSTYYRIQKFTRRNRRFIATATIVAAALLIGTFLSVWQAIEAHQARAKTEASLRRESEARDQTEESFKIARQAIEATTRKIASDPRLREANHLAMRKELLASALPFYQRLGKQKTNDHRLQLEMANTLRDRAELHRHLGDLEAVRTDYQMAITAFEKLATFYPNADEMQFYLADSHRRLAMAMAEMGEMPDAEMHLRTAQKLMKASVSTSSELSIVRCHASVTLNLGQVLRATRRYEEAEQEIRRAIDIHKSIPPEKDAALEDDDLLASAWNALGVLQMWQKRHLEAERSFSASCNEYRRLIAIQPGNISLKSGLSSSLDNLGTTLDAQGKQTDFLAVDRESLEIIESLIEEFPNVPSYQVSLGAKNCNTGIHLLENGLPAESLPYFDKAVASLQIVLARDSRIVSARQFLANSYGSMGRALDKLERHTEAIAAFDQAMEWVAESRKPSFVFMKARVVGKTQPEQAKSLVEEYLRRDSAALDMRYDAACFYSHLASITTDKSDQDRHVQRALLLLTQARDQGFFTPPQVAHFRSDSDFTFLRNHVDFQAFEMSLPIAPPQK
jgi:eukaryotic-like serine/threonine-protein kinase